MKKAVFSGWIGIFLAGFTLWADISPADLQLMKQHCQAASREPWRSIPWKISLVEAQQVAVEERKPIFIWAMDGHPLGCT
jgi:hypothetical protein